MIKKDDITATIMLVQVRGLSVFGTGHEFNDRNSGLEPNSLLIRTTCLYSAEVELAAHNRHGHADGFLRLGAGFTWGTSKFGLPGAHQLARDSGRTVVSGHAGNVGVVFVFVFVFQYLQFN